MQYVRECRRSLWLVLLVLSGCSTHQPIHGTNDSAPFGFVRFGVGKEERARLELSLARTRGDFSQQLHEGETVSVGDGHNFNGPTTLKGDAVINLGTLMVRHTSLYADGTVGMELGAGVAFASSQLELQSAKRDDSTLCFGVGGAFLWHDPARHHGLRAATDVYIGPLGDSIIRYELLGTLRTGRHFEWMAGIQGLGVWFNEWMVSDLELNYFGPALGLHVRF